MLEMSNFSQKVHTKEHQECILWRISALRSSCSDDKVIVENVALQNGDPIFGDNARMGCLNEHMSPN